MSLNHKKNNFLLVIVIRTEENRVNLEVKNDKFHSETWHLSFPRC